MKVAIAKCEELIIVSEERGSGCQFDERRPLRLIYDKDGTLLAQHDPHAPRHQIHTDGVGHFQMSLDAKYGVQTVEGLLHIRSGRAWNDLLETCARLRIENSKLQGSEEGRKYERAVAAHLHDFVSANPKRWRHWRLYQDKHPLVFPAPAGAMISTSDGKPIGKIDTISIDAGQGLKDYDLAKPAKQLIGGARGGGKLNSLLRKFTATPKRRKRAKGRKR